MRYIAIGLATLATITTTAQAMPPKGTPRWPHQRLSIRYLSLYSKVGAKRAGRNIVWQDQPSKQQLIKSIAIMERILHPPAVEPLPVASTSTSSVPANYSPSGGDLPYCTWGPESGGNWYAVNPTSGAYGKYQITPDHWSTGVCRGLGQDPAGQTECAHRVLATEGLGAWVNC